MSAEVLGEAAAEIRADVAALPEQTVTAVRVKSVAINGRQHLTWDPAVALLVADWLDHSAYLWQYGDIGIANKEHSLAVAHAYLRVDQ